MKKLYLILAVVFLIIAVIMFVSIAQVETFDGTVMNLSAMLEGICFTIVGSACLIAFELHKDNDSLPFVEEAKPEKLPEGQLWVEKDNKRIKIYEKEHDEYLADGWTDVK